MITREGKREMAKLVDFGLARVYQGSNLSGLTLKGQVGGTLAFMPPEQILQFREARPAVDQYAAAATLYNLLTGRFVFDLPSAYHKALLVILQDAPVPVQERRPDIPDEVARIIHRGLERESSARFGSVGEMRRALVECVR
jgi:serine/threonine-protein kinase